MPYVPVRTTDFTGSNGTNIETLVTWLDPFPNSAGGYYAVLSNACKLEFSQDGTRGLADITGTYTNDQYAQATLGGLALASNAWLDIFLQCQGTRANPPTATSHYRVRISQDSGESPRTTKIQKVTSGTSVSDLASMTSPAWANGDKVRFEIVGGVLSVYRDSGSGFGTAILTHTDGSPLTGGVPGFNINYADQITLDDVEFGDVTAASPPVLSSSTVTGVTATGATVGCSTNTASGTLFAVVTTSSTQPSIAQIKAGQNHTGAAATYASSQSISSTGAKTFSATGLSSGVSYWAHFVHNSTDGDSNRVSTVAIYPGTYRPAADVTTTSWVASSGSDFFALIDEDTPGSDSDFVTSPTLTGSTAPITFRLADIGAGSSTLASGAWTVRVRAKTNSGTATMRAYLLNDSNTVQGTSNDVTINTTFGTYNLTFSTTGNATRVRIEVVV